MTNDDIVDAYASGFEAGDPEVVLGLIAPGAAIWHNFDQVDRDIASSIGELGRMNERFADLRFDIVERFPLADGIGIRLVMRGTVRATGEPFVSHQAKFFRIRDGKVTRIEEYVAPA